MLGLYGSCSSVACIGSCFGATLSASSGAGVLWQNEGYEGLGLEPEMRIAKYSQVHA